METLCSGFSVARLKQTQGRANAPFDKRVDGAPFFRQQTLRLLKPNVKLPREWQAAWKARTKGDLIIESEDSDTGA